MFIWKNDSENNISYCEKNTLKLFLVINAPYNCWIEIRYGRCGLNNKIFGRFEMSAPKRANILRVAMNTMNSFRNRNS